MTRAASRYVHGTSPGEQERLSRLNAVLNETSVAALGLSGGERILDIGSGLGQLSRAMARGAGPGGRVIAVERSPEQIAEAVRLSREAGEEGLVEIRQGDALDLPLSGTEWGSFDLAHARFVLEHVPDPLAVVRAMVRAVRPGGRIVLEDDDHEVLRVWPPVAGIAEVWAAYMRTYEMNGNDPIVGRRLVELLHAGGAGPVENRWLFFGGCSGDPHFPALVENMVSILEGARAAILGTAMLPAEKTLDDVIGRLRGWSERPDAALWFARSWAAGRRPG